MGTILTPSSRRDVEQWAMSGVAGNLAESEAARLANAVIDDVFERGLRYGDNWSEYIDSMSELEFGDYVLIAINT